MCKGIEKTMIKVNKIGSYNLATLITVRLTYKIKEKEKKIKNLED